MTTVIILVIFSYLLGSVPTGYLIAKKTMGIDIREHGSGNPGAANVYRTVGKWAGISTFLIDALNGFIPVCLANSKASLSNGIFVPLNFLEKQIPKSYSNASAYVISPILIS